MAANGSTTFVDQIRTMKFLQILSVSIALSLVFHSCKKEKTPEEENPSCAIPTPQLNLAGSGDGFTVYSSTAGGYGFFEVQYGPNGFQLGSGTTVTNNGAAITGLANGTYDVYLRGNCGGNDWSNWGGPVSILITQGSSSTCYAPSNLDQYWSQYDYLLNWDGDFEDNYYEVEYGPTGFIQGTGTVATTNNTYYSKGVFTANTTYDFYVRANCGGSDWSAWAGPASFYADVNANRCLKPLGVTANRVGSYIEVDIDPDGESVHEVNFNSYNFNDSENIHTQTQSNGTYGTFSTSTTWYLWVRSVCQDGSKTEWVGPTVIN